MESLAHWVCRAQGSVLSSATACVGHLQQAILLHAADVSVLIERKIYNHVDFKSSMHKLNTIFQLLKL